MPFNYRIGILTTSVALIVFPIILVIAGCNAGDYQCTFESFPYVSATMGVFPNNKTYIFFMNLFSFF
jgi:hypothetical protein